MACLGCLCVWQDRYGKWKSVCLNPCNSISSFLGFQSIDSTFRIPVMYQALLQIRPSWPRCTRG